MSAEENKALLRRVFEEGWNAGNLDLFDETDSPEYEFGALMLERAGALRILEEAELAARIDQRVERIYRLKGQTRNIEGHPFLAFRWISRQYA